MQQILAFTRKELQLWAHRPGSWIVVFVVPLIFIAIIQAVFGSNGTPVVTIFAVNQDKSAEASQVMEALRNSENLKIEELKTREEADQRVGRGERMAAVIVPENFGLTVTSPGGASIEILVDPAHLEQASIVKGLVNAALSRVIVSAEVNREVEESVSAVMKTLPASTPQPGQNAAAPVTDPLRKFFTAAIKGVVSSQVDEALANPVVTVDAQPLQNVNAQAAHRPSLIDSLVPGYSLMFVFFLISNLAGTMIDERESGTLRRLLVAPVARSQILLGKMVPYLLIAVVQFVVVLLASRLIFGVDLGHSVVALAIVILASSLAMATLGILIAAFARSENQANGLATVLVLAMAVVSGAMFPSISIPGLKAITPHYWALQGFVNVIARGQGSEGVLLPAGILLTMSAIFFTIGAIKFRFE